MWVTSLSDRYIRQDIEAKIMLTARFFDSEGEDFTEFLADWFVVTLETGRDAAEAFAKDIVATYEAILLSDLENLNTV